MKLKTLALAQLRVGALGFGGPLATMSMMREELIRKRALIPEQKYLEGLGFVKLLPGPVSSMLAVFLGMEVAGAIGGLLSVAAFVLPSFLALLFVSIAEDLLQNVNLPYAASGFEALQTAVLIVILFTCWQLFKDAWNRSYFGHHRPAAVSSFALLAAGAAFFRVPELAILLSCAVGGIFLFYTLRSHHTLALHPLSLFWIFFTAGITVFGTGYMVLPHLERVLVTDGHLLSAEDFLRSVTYGNLTPGPVVIASTYMGFKISGFSGALAATVGIFLGPILLILVLKPFTKKIFAQKWIEGAWLGLLPAVASTIAVSLIFLGLKVHWNLVQVAVCCLTALLVLRKISVVKIFSLIFVLGSLSYFLKV